MAKSKHGFFSELNHVVFWPPFILLGVAVVLNFVAPDSFAKLTNGANAWVLGNFGWLFSLCAFGSVVLCGYICFSNFGKIRFGGVDAQPLMSKWNWFSITICTTIAIGILFWATAEPVTHFVKPPVSSGIESESHQAATFAMSTMYLHWSFTPYAMYAVCSLMFGFAYYNMKMPYSLGSTLVPLFGERLTGKLGNVVDAVCLYALVAGMAAALGAGILQITAGLNEIFGVPRNSLVWACVASAIVGLFVVSSATGLMKGIRILSDINTKALLALVLVAFIVGPTVKILNFGLESFGVYLNNFFGSNLFMGAAANDPWSQGWTVFYWAVWLAWAPITACFLGRIAYGRTVREFMLINFVFPSLFSIGWMAIFGTIAIELQKSGVDLYGITQDKTLGTEAVSYAVLKTFPFAFGVVLFYLVSTFICFVTSADSNTSAMACISSTGISPDNPEGNTWIKIIWGVTVGAVAWVMISFTGGVEGIKIISNLGGFPAAILVLLIIVALFRVVSDPQAYNRIDQAN